MPASTEPHYGEVWRYNGRTLWLFLARTGSLGKWSVLYLGAQGIPPHSLWETRMKEGRELVDEMWGPGTKETSADWTRVE